MAPDFLQLIGRPPVWDLLGLYRGWNDPRIETDLEAGGERLKRLMAYADLSVLADHRQAGRGEALRRRVLARSGLPETTDSFEARLARDRMSPRLAETLMAAVEGLAEPAVSPPGRARFSWRDGVMIVVAAQAELAPEPGETARRLFAERRIHARPSRWKSLARLSYPVDGSAFVILTWRERAGDVVALAHEIGHAVHQTLAPDEPSRAVAELAAVLSEAAALRRLNSLGHDIGGLKAEAARRDLIGAARGLARERAGGAPAEAPYAGIAYVFGRLAGEALDRVRAADPVAFARRWRAVLEAGEAISCEEVLDRFGLPGADAVFWRAQAAALLSGGDPPL